MGLANWIGKLGKAAVAGGLGSIQSKLLGGDASTGFIAGAVGDLALGKLSSISHIRPTSINRIRARNIATGLKAFTGSSMIPFQLATIGGSALSIIREIPRATEQYDYSPMRATEGLIPAARRGAITGALAYGIGRGVYGKANLYFGRRFGFKQKNILNKIEGEYKARNIEKDLEYIDEAIRQKAYRNPIKKSSVSSSTPALPYHGYEMVYVGQSGPGFLHKASRNISSPTPGVIIRNQRRQLKGFSIKKPVYQKEPITNPIAMLIKEMAASKSPRATAGGGMLPGPGISSETGSWQMELWRNPKFGFSSKTVSWPETPEQIKAYNIKTGGIKRTRIGKFADAQQPGSIYEKYGKEVLSDINKREKLKIIKKNKKIESNAKKEVFKPREDVDIHQIRNYLKSWRNDVERGRSFSEQFNNHQLLSKRQRDKVFKEWKDLNLDRFNISKSDMFTRMILGESTGSKILGGIIGISAYNLMQKDHETPQPGLGTAITVTALTGLGIYGAHKAGFTKAMWDKITNIDYGKIFERGWEAGKTIASSGAGITGFTLRNIGPATIGLSSGLGAWQGYKNTGTTEGMLVGAATPIAFGIVGGYIGGKTGAMSGALMGMFGVSGVTSAIGDIIGQNKRYEAMKREIYEAPGGSIGAVLTGEGIPTMGAVENLFITPRRIKSRGMQPDHLSATGDLVTSLHTLRHTRNPGIGG